MDSYQLSSDYSLEFHLILMSVFFFFFFLKLEIGVVLGLNKQILVVYQTSKGN